MESFRGSLAHYRLQLLVPALFEGQLISGVLSVERGAIRREFKLWHGRLVAASSTAPEEHLSQILVELRILTASQAAAAFEGAEQERTWLGAFLVDKGIVEASRLREALAFKARESFVDCYEWESGEVSLLPGTLSQPTGIELDLPLQSLHRDALARLKEWRAFHLQFPDPRTTFAVLREAAPAPSAEDEALLDRVEKGQPLSLLLYQSGDRPLQMARRVLHLYRRGALVIRATDSPNAQRWSDVAELVALSRQNLEQGQFEVAAELSAQALEHASVPEAQALFRDAEKRLAESLAGDVRSLEGRLQFHPLPPKTPAELNSDDFYLYSKLRSLPSIAEMLRTSPMGELAAYRSIRRLMDCGLITVVGGAPALKLRGFSLRSLRMRPDAEGFEDDADRTQPGSGHG